MNFRNNVISTKLGVEGDTTSYYCKTRVSHDKDEHHMSSTLI